MLEKEFSDDADYLRLTINQEYRTDERLIVAERIRKAQLTEDEIKSIQDLATQLVEKVRKSRKNSLGMDSFLHEYALSSEEGIALMCLAEALLRVPDNTTIDDLIEDKLTAADWQSHQGHSDSFFVNAATWALTLTGKVLSPEQTENMLMQKLQQTMKRTGKVFIRSAVEKAMQIMSRQFVMGRTIQEALQRARKKETLGYRYSYDMLGEAALTAKDAERYFEAYKNAIKTIGESAAKTATLYQRAGISIKLSALHPRYQESQRELVLEELPPKLLMLAQLAKFYNIGLTIDAEESERLNLSLDLIEKVFSDPSLDGWEGFGVAVQSYQKRAYPLLDWLADLARRCQRRIIVRLIKGAYWDSEIKKAQMLGLKDYPVFTSKAFTDVSFQACVKKILTLTDAIYPQFATHNAYSVAMILTLTQGYQDFEFQCLHGMGTELYNHIVAQGIPCRIYAPVGSYEDLLPYLVRRILENGANSSFVNRIADDTAPIRKLIEDPLLRSALLLEKNRSIPSPAAIMVNRKNSSGLDWSDRAVRLQLKQELKAIETYWQAYPIIAGQKRINAPVPQYSPQQFDRIIGEVSNTTEKETKEALVKAEQAFHSWSKQSVDFRASCVEKFAEILAAEQTQILTILCLEAGKTWLDAHNELREAIDYCYYYAMMAKKIMQYPQNLSGYTGEYNILSWHPRGIIACISPWNFPLAIFSGQIIAALVTGNVVIAKPAEQTPLIAAFTVQLMQKAGIPPAVIQLLPGSGELIGSLLVKDERIKGVIFTGSTKTAKIINQHLAQRIGGIIPFIAETGGQNTMIVDSSALLEQVVVDVLSSAFGSAGQRCSALRVLYLQEEIYQQTVNRLQDAMQVLNIGNPACLSTDIGPVIDAEALARLKQHCEKNKTNLIYQAKLSKYCQFGYFMPPTILAISSIQELKEEVFGPILHVIAYKKEALDAVIHEINSTGYGLTLGIHSRINEKVNYIRERVHVGNCYVNRNMIGAVVGLQPFGGEGLSGTGPKAGGPHYLQRLCFERTFTVDTTAAGGNASLMALAEEC